MSTLSIILLFVSCIATCWYAIECILDLAADRAARKIMRQEQAKRAKAHMKQSIKLAQYTEEIKESALLYGIDSNEANVAATSLIQSRASIQSTVGRSTVSRIIKKVSDMQSGITHYVKVSVKRRRSRISHIVRGIVSASHRVLVKISFINTIKTFLKGENGDDTDSTI